MSKLNEKEFLCIISEMEVDENVSEYVTERLAKINANEAKKKEAALEKAKQDAPLVKGIVDFLTEQDEPVKAAEIASHLGISTSKVVALVKGAIENGEIVKTDNGKSKPATYSIGGADEVENEDE